LFASILQHLIRKVAAKGIIIFFFLEFPTSGRSKSIFFKNKTNIVEKLPIAKNPSKITLYITPEFAEITKNDKSDLTLDEEYQLTITKLNNMLIHKQNFKIKNFIIS